MAQNICQPNSAIPFIKIFSIIVNLFYVMNIKKNYGYYQYSNNNNKSIKQEQHIVVGQWGWHMEQLTVLPI